ncbi:unnamed protein product, partial [Sphagnum tenellum]
WMQLVMMIYHISGGNHIMPVYLQMRTLVSSYIFLNGFVWFVHFWNKDLSLPRAVQVLFRLNFFVLVLCIVMKTNYMTYYIVPLLSFWWIVQYGMLSIMPKMNENNNNVHIILVLLIKTGIVTYIISILDTSEYAFEQLFMFPPWKRLFSLSSFEYESGMESIKDISEWRFRWKLDRFSMLYGSIFAFCICTLKKMDIGGFSNYIALSPVVTKFCVIMTCLTGLLAYAITSGLPEQYNRMHPITAILPIISFMLMRNMFGFLKAHYSRFFAWIGTFSIELFVCQYHISMANDGT